MSPASFGTESLRHVLVKNVQKEKRLAVIR